MAPTLQAKVKSVLSGDTIVLVGKPRPDGKLPNERILSLAYVSAPRMKRDGDEPFAFAAREYLRKLVVGKEVQFSVSYTVSTMTPPRENGMVFLPGMNVLEKVVAEGWVKVREQSAKKERSEEEEAIISKLKGLEEQAKAAGNGIWSATGGKVEMKPDVAGKEKEFLEQWKGMELDAIIEATPSADRFRARILFTDGSQQIIPIVLAGVRSPSASKKAGAGDDVLGESGAQAEEFGDEARWFVESKLLQRNVKVELIGLNQAGSMFVAKVKHPAGDIAQLLVLNGLARCADWMSPMLGGDGMQRLRDAERKAKSRQLNIWRGHTPKAPQTSSSFEAVVLKIVNGDTIEIGPKNETSRRTVQFSSIRQPRTNDPKQAAWQVEVREYLRKRLIGKTIHVQIDYTKPASEGFGARDAASIILNGKNIAHELVERGYATVIRHRKDDEDRSPSYDTLLEFEQTAITEAKGIHSGKDSKYAGQRIVDASENLTRAKQFLSTFQRHKRLPGVIEHVSAGSRFRILIPRENCRVTFVLGGLRAPRAGRPGEKSEEGGEEALDWSSRKAYQRDCEVEVETTDRAGGFIGNHFVGGNNLGKGLLEEGFAWVQGGNGEAEYDDAEARAKAARKGIWKDWDETKEIADAKIVNGGAATEPAKARTEFIDAVVTNLNEDGSLAIQVIGDSVHALDRLMKEFRVFHEAGGSSTPANLRAGDLVAARFSADNEYYRAKVKKVDRAAQKADVVFIDYGNLETVKFSAIRSIGQPSFTALPAQAKDAHLSFITLPPASSDYGVESHREFEHLTANKSLVANVDFRAPNGTMHLTLWDPKTGSEGPESSINAEMVKSGLARVVRAKKRGWEKAYGSVLEVLEREERAAQLKREGMWEYGHVGDSDED